MVSATPVLSCTTKYYSSTTILLQYYSVLQSTNPVLLCTAKYYSSTTLYYKVLLCTTQYYSSTTLYYTALLQYYSHDWSASPMKLYLQCAEQQRCFYKITDCCACHAKWLSWSILFTHETLFTMRGVTSVIVQLHQMLRLPRKMNLMIDPCHTWNAIYNARSNKCHCPNSPNAAPATKNESHHWSSSHMKRYLQCAEQQVSLSKLTKYCACHEKWPSRISKKFAENGWNVISNARPIRAWSEHDPRMKPSVRNPPRNRGYLSRPPRAFCIEKYNISRSGYHSKFHRILRLPRKVTLELHQILRLPRKMNLMIDPGHTWNAIYNARSNKCHCPNSPNAAPATKNDRPESQRNLLKTDETSFPMRGRSEHDPSMKPSVRNPPRNRGYTFHAHHEHFVLKNTTFRAPAIIPNFTEYCACHEKWHLNFTKYCACHEKWISWLILVTHETLFTMRGATSVIVQTHQMLRLPRKMNLMIDPLHTWNAIYKATSVIVQTHQILRLPRKMNLMIDPWHKWNVIYNARSNMRHSPNSPNTAPATKNDRPESQRNLLKTDETSSQIFQSTLVLFDPKKIEVFFSKKLEVFSLKK